jgi:NAD(P)-dependent dehydrogenase (short-subunit alcohol dehydrogenase family)
VESPTALVTGAGRGIGRATVHRFLAEGWRVVAGVRDVEAARAAYGEREGLLLVQLDVTDRGSVREAVERAEAHAGGPLRCLVNNAGYALMGAQEDADLDSARGMFETNLWGPASVIQAALPAMREAGEGVVVNVSSIGAQLSTPLLGFYNASKAGLSALSEALAIECRPFGIRVAMIEPGMVDTDFPRATRVSGSLAEGRGPYRDLLAGLRRGFGAWRQRQSAPPEAVADAVVGAASDVRSPFRIRVGPDAERLGRSRSERGDEAWQDELCAFLELDWPRRAP